MIVNIIAGSPFNYDIVKAYPADITIGVDYGAYRVIENHEQLDAAFGDFDSITTYQLVKLLNSCPKVNKYKKEKDHTDTEIALDYALTLNPDVIQLFGVTGKRIDHFLSVLNLFQRVFSNDVQLFIIDEYNKIYVKKPGTYHVKKSSYQFYSFFAYFNDVKDLTLTHFKYELINYHLKDQDTRCISNEIIDKEGIISFKEGLLLIVESHD